MKPGRKRYAASLGGLALVVALAPGCHEHPPPVFTVEPAQVCPGQVVEVHWEVSGQATLRTERSATDWDEEAVPPSGRRRLAPAVTTTFTLGTPDANPAKGPSFGTRTVEVVRASGERRVLSRCDAATARCTGSFEIGGGAGALQARRLSLPLAIQGGRSHAIELCVTHDGMPRTCVGPEQAVEVAAAATGSWTLEAVLPAGLSVTPPPALAVQLELGCQ
ncbi:MAG TPA: hypothetical protein VFK02_15575 [Kofleriaceae bacterium]|nr:hypothetical protein [Kofleriaceae bacterium]